LNPQIWRANCINPKTHYIENIKGSYKKNLFFKLQMEAEGRLKW
jgi:hypothetical protein